jgi:hypothetical protein
MLQSVQLNMVDEIAVGSLRIRNSSMPMESHVASVHMVSAQEEHQLFVTIPPSLSQPDAGSVFLLCLEKCTGGPQIKIINAQGFFAASKLQVTSEVAARRITDKLPQYRVVILEMFACTCHDGTIPVEPQIENEDTSRRALKPQRGNIVSAHSTTC